MGRDRESGIAGQSYHAPALAAGGRQAVNFNALYCSFGDEDNHLHPVVLSKKPKITLSNTTSGSLLHLFLVTTGVENL